MEKLALYRNHIKELIRRHSHPSAYGDVEMQNNQRTDQTPQPSVSLRRCGDAEYLRHGA